MKIQRLMLLATVLSCGTYAAAASWLIDRYNWQNCKVFGATYETYTMGENDIPMDDIVGTNWYATDYDDSGWNTLSGGWLDQDGNWNLGEYACYWTRQTFEVSDIDQEFWYIGTNDDNVWVYVNGEFVGFGGCQDNLEFNLNDYVVEGTNHIAVKVVDFGGAYHLNYGVYHLTKPQDVTIDEVSYSVRLYPDFTASIIRTNDATPQYLTLPSEVTVAGDTYTFTEVEKEAFSSKDLHGITIPASYTHLGDYAFHNNNNVEYVILLGSSLADEDNWSTFEGSRNCILYVPENSDYLFRQRGSWNDFRDIVEGTDPLLPFTVDGLNYSPISGTSVALKPSTVTTSTLHIPATVSDGTHTFDVVEIAESAFSGNQYITTVTMGDNVREIKGHAFRDCSKLESIQVSKSLRYLLEEALSGTAITTLHLPACMEGLWHEGFAFCEKLQSIDIDEERDDQRFHSIDGVVYEENALHIYPRAKKDATFTIAETVGNRTIESIRFRTIFANEYLTEITIPYTISNMEDGCLWALPNLKRVNFNRYEPAGWNYDYLHYDIDWEGKEPTPVTIYAPKNRLDIYTSAYGIDGSREWLSIAEGSWVAPFENIEVNGLYYSMKGKNEARIVNRTDDIRYTNITIPTTITVDNEEYTVTEIGDNAMRDLEGCAELTIPATINKIGHEAFGWSQGGLQKVTFLGNVPVFTNNNCFNDCWNIQNIYVPGEYYEAYEAHEYLRNWSLRAIGSIDDQEIDGFIFSQVGAQECVRIIGYNREVIGDTELIELPASVTIDGKTYSVTQIGRDALHDLPTRALVIPATVTRIEGRAICNGYDNLLQVTFLGNVPVLIENNIFEDCWSIREIRVNETYLEDYQNHEYFHNWHIYSMNYDGPMIDESFSQTVNGVEWIFRVIAQNEVLVDGCNSNGRRDLAIPAQATTHKKNTDYTFNVVSTRWGFIWDWHELRSFTFPSTMKYISDGTLIGCDNLKTIILECGADTQIGDAAFDNCLGLEAIYVTAETSPLVRHQIWWNYDFRPQTTLYVSSVAAIEAYRNYSYEEDGHTYYPWAEFKAIGLDEDYSEGITLADGTPYYNANAQQVPNFSYTRNYPEDVWTTIVLPISLQYEDWSEGFDIAEIYDVNVHDNNHDGQVDDIEIEGIYLREGSVTEAGVPYFIRRKIDASADSQVLSLNDCQLETNTLWNLECSNTKMDFLFCGTYSGVSGAQMLAGKYYAMADGAWCLAQDASASLKPMRAYLQITDKKTGTPVAISNEGKGNAPLRVTVSDFGTEAISTVEAEDCGNNGRVTISSRLIGMPAGHYKIGDRNVEVVW